MYPDLPRKQRETEVIKKYPAVFIIGIGWTLGGNVTRQTICGATGMANHGRLRGTCMSNVVSDLCRVSPRCCRRHNVRENPVTSKYGNLGCAWWPGIDGRPWRNVG